MIKNRLAVLLAERNLKITQVAKDTGISRNTITSTAQNDGKMIQLQTIDILCNYLDITPADFFEYYNALLNISVFVEDVSTEVVYGDFFLNEASLNNLEADIYLDFNYPNGKTISFRLEANIHEEKNKIKDFESFVGGNSSIEILINFQDSDEHQLFIEQVWKELSVGFQSDLIDEVKEKTLNSVKEYLIENIDNSDKTIILGGSSNSEKSWSNDIDTFISQFKINFASLLSK